MNTVAIYLPYIQSRQFVFLFTAIFSGLFNTIQYKSCNTSVIVNTDDTAFNNILNDLDIHYKLTLIKTLIIDKCFNEQGKSTTPIVEYIDYVYIEQYDICKDCSLPEHIKLAMGKLLETASDLYQFIEIVRFKINNHNNSIIRHFYKLDMKEEMNKVKHLSEKLDKRYRLLIDVLTIG